MKKKTKLSMVLLALLLVFALTGCMRGGNADKGDDGIIDDEEKETVENVIDDVKDSLGDVKDGIENRIREWVPGLDEDNGVKDRDNEVYDGGVEPNGDSGLVIQDDSYGTYNNGGSINGSRDVSNGGGGLNGSGMTGNGLQNDRTATSHS